MLKTSLSNAGARVQSLVRELRSHMLHSQENKTENRNNMVTNSTKTFKMVHIKKKKSKKKKRNCIIFLSSSQPSQEINSAPLAQSPARSVLTCSPDPEPALTQRWRPCLAAPTLGICWVKLWDGRCLELHQTERTCGPFHRGKN